MSLCAFVCARVCASCVCVFGCVCLCVCVYATPTFLRCKEAILNGIERLQCELKSLAASSCTCCACVHMRLCVYVRARVCECVCVCVYVCLCLRVCVQARACLCVCLCVCLCLHLCACRYLLSVCLCLSVCRCLSLSLSLYLCVCVCVCVCICACMDKHMVTRVHMRILCLHTRTIYSNLQQYHTGPRELVEPCCPQPTTSHSISHDCNIGCIALLADATHVVGRLPASVWLQRCRRWRRNQIHFSTLLGLCWRVKVSEFL